MKKEGLLLVSTTTKITTTHTFVECHILLETSMQAKYGSLPKWKDGDIFYSVGRGTNSRAQSSDENEWTNREDTNNPGIEKNHYEGDTAGCENPCRGSSWGQETPLVRAFVTSSAWPRCVGWLCHPLMSRLCHTMEIKKCNTTCF